MRSSGVCRPQSKRNTTESQNEFTNWKAKFRQARLLKRSRSLQRLSKNADCLRAFSSFSISALNQLRHFSFADSHFAASLDWLASARVDGPEMNVKHLPQELLFV
jgi:hypothetical protein